MLGQKQFRRWKRMDDSRILKLALRLMRRRARQRDRLETLRYNAIGKYLKATGETTSGAWVERRLIDKPSEKTPVYAVEWKRVARPDRRPVEQQTDSINWRDHNRRLKATDRLAIIKANKRNRLRHVQAQLRQLQVAMTQPDQPSHHPHRWDWLYAPATRNDDGTFPANRLADPVEFPADVWAYLVDIESDDAMVCVASWYWIMRAYNPYTPNETLLRRASELTRQELRIGFALHADDEFPDVDRALERKLNNLEQTIELRVAECELRAFNATLASARELSAIERERQLAVARECAGLELCELLAQGKTWQQCADALSISKKTISKRLQHARQRWQFELLALRGLDDD